MKTLTIFDKVVGTISDSVKKLIVSSKLRPDIFDLFSFRILFGFPLPIWKLDMVLF